MTSAFSSNSPAPGWANRGGTVVVLSVNPVVVQLAAVPMVARAGDAVGSFVFDGSGTFR